MKYHTNIVDNTFFILFISIGNYILFIHIEMLLYRSKKTTEFFAKTDIATNCDTKGQVGQNASCTHKTNEINGEVVICNCLLTYIDSATYHAEIGDSTCRTRRILS